MASIKAIRNFGIGLAAHCKRLISFFGASMFIVKVFNF